MGRRSAHTSTHPDRSHGEGRGRGRRGRAADVSATNRASASPAAERRPPLLLPPLRLLLLLPPLLPYTEHRRRFAAAGDVPPPLACASPHRSFTHTGRAAELGRHSPRRKLPSSSSAAATAAATAPASSPSSSRPPPPAPGQSPPPRGARLRLPADVEVAGVHWLAYVSLVRWRPPGSARLPLLLADPPPSLFLPAASPAGLAPPLPSVSQVSLLLADREFGSRVGRGRSWEERGCTRPLWPHLASASRPRTHPRAASVTVPCWLGYPQWSNRRSELRGPGTWWNVRSPTGRGTGLSKELWDSSPQGPGQL
ncbi:extensin-like [Phyllostomus discolor]|uniref:Extensin-like n=1 Tax=Phyllostomus discolor TaxID=89673 RepID=A0A7E6CI87_9CHIR|nr:extensin-like [Phyllostomus discolor]